ncbi:MAG: histidine--tRNA ligase [Bacteroidia bacterium]|nr:histidine--tRNA ligase [Bacteroidia bacterium]
MEKPSLPSGTRDFGPEIMKKRKFVLSVMERVFRSHGFLPIETPSLENLKTLQGKYGDEGDQLLFKVLNSGEYFSKIKPENWPVSPADTIYKDMTPQISDRGLRYDLTVPLARFVVMNRDKLAFPFKRYQMQPVWRADRPQKGRYREFWQCDIDIVGSNSVVSEAELVECYQEVFAQLNLEVQIKINHRLILDAFLPLLGGREQWNAFMVAIDKFDKIGQEGVNNELLQRDLKNAIPAWNTLCEIAALNSTEDKLLALESFSEIQNEILTQGIAQVKELLDLLPRQQNVVLDLRLARGLSYYTGCVFEVVSNDDRVPADFRIGSIGGGGRYNNLTGVFGLKDVPGVGVSFGLDRILDTLESANLLEVNNDWAGVLICCMEEAYLSQATQIARELRIKNVICEVYPGAPKLKKQLDYANSKGCKYALILGESEMQQQHAMVKNLVTGEQQLLDWNALSDHITLN